VAVLSFVCSVGNVPLAAVLWNGGSSFGGVLALIYADLIVLPILNIYRKYYGLKIAVFLFVTMYASMARAALAIELIFKAVGLIPSDRHAKIIETAIQWNYTTIFNIIFLILAVMLIIRFLSQGRDKDAEDDGRSSSGTPRIVTESVANPETTTAIRYVQWLTVGCKEKGTQKGAP
jgi:uncharacterized membrane protein YraQ (UPF0718 family)